jgi:hypothetical protein
VHLPLPHTDPTSVPFLQAPPVPFFACFVIGPETSASVTFTRIRRMPSLPSWRARLAGERLL